MAAPPDLINDPPSLICRYKDRRQAPISFSFSLLFLPSSCSPRTATKSPSMERAGEVESKRLFRSWSEQTRERASSTLVPSPSYCSKALSPAFRPFCHFLRLDAGRETTVRQIVRPSFAKIRTPNPFISLSFPIHSEQSFSSKEFPILVNFCFR